MRCPRCGYTSYEFETCPRCEILFEYTHKRDIHDIPKGGFWIRLVAYIFDNIFIFIGASILTLMAAFGAGLGGILKGMDPEEMEEIAAVFSMVIGIIFGPAYFTFFTGLEGQTLGKRIMGLRVVSTTGERIGYGRALLRYLGYYISFIPFGLGFIMIGISKRKRGFHDIIAGTYVIRTKKWPCSSFPVESIPHPSLPLQGEGIEGGGK